MKKLLLTILCLFILPLISLQAAEDKQLFILNELEDKQRQIIDLTAIDINRDGLEELLVTSRRGQYPDYQRLLEIYFLENNKYPNEPQLSYAVKKEDIAFDWLEIKPHKNLALAVVTAQGLNFYSLYREKNSGRYLLQTTSQRSIKASSLLQRPQRGSFFHLPLSFDLANGKKIILLPTITGALLIDPLNKQKTTTLKTACHQYYAVRDPYQKFNINFSLRSRSWFPKITIADHNGDGLGDIFFLWQDEADVFEQGKNGSFKTGPSKHYYFGKISEEERKKGRSFVNIEIADLDGNGLADFVLNHYRGQLPNLSSAAEVILRQKDNTQKKIDIPIDKGKVTGIMFNDLDRDKQSELIVASAKIGVLSIVRALLTGKIPILFKIIPFNSSSGFSGKARYRRSISFSFNVANSEIRGFTPILVGDFDGDSLLDSLYALNKDQLTIDLFRRQDYFNADQALTYAVKTSKHLLVKDLNNDQRSDIIFYYPQSSEQGKIVVLLNNKISQRKGRDKAANRF